MLHADWSNLLAPRDQLIRHWPITAATPKWRQLQQPSGGVWPLQTGAVEQNDHNARHCRLLNKTLCRCRFPHFSRLHRELVQFSNVLSPHTLVFLECLNIPFRKVNATLLRHWPDRRHVRRTKTRVYLISCVTCSRHFEHHHKFTPSRTSSVMSLRNLA